MTRLTYSLPEASRATMTLYDLSGREMMTLVDGSMLAGVHSVMVNGASLASGVYFVELNAGSSMSRWKVTLVK